jgi:hypothetical protein
MSFEEITDFGKLLESGVKCCNGGRWKPSIQMFELNLLQWTAETKRKLETNTYKPKKTNDFLLNERGKQREIKAHHVSDRMVYKSFCKYELIPATENLIVSGNSASQVGKGTDYAIKKFRADLVHAYKVCKGRDFYVYTFDFHNYFGSIPHEKADELIGSRLSDNRSKRIFREYMDVFPGDVGIGIGGEPSQVVAVAFPSSIDRMIECDPNVIAYGRYMDDGYIIMKSKEDLRDLSQRFKIKCNDMGMILNEKHTKMSWMEKDSITFLKKRTFVSETGKIVMRLTRKNVTFELRRLKMQRKALDRGEMPMSSIRDSFQCWCSYARKYNSYHAMVTVTKRYCEYFNIEWSEAKRLWKKKKS